MEYAVKNNPLLEGYVPVEERDWYPWVWPDAATLTAMQRKTPVKYQEWLKELRELALSDFFFFNDEIMRDSRFPHLDTKLHGEMCWISQHNNEFLELVPRYHLKTTIGTVNDVLWELAKDTNICILIRSAVDTLAQMCLAEIKEHILMNKRYKLLFPKVRPMRKTGAQTNGWAAWNKDMILIERNIISKDPSVMIAGAATTITGVHMNKIINDDLMAEKNAENPEMIEKIIQVYMQNRFILLPGGKISNIGTRKKDGDLYGWLMDETNMPFYVRAAIEDGEPIWPEPTIVAKVMSDKQVTDGYTWACEMLNDPIDRETQVFKPVHKHFWNKQLLREKLVMDPSENDAELLDKWMATLDIYLGLDPARKKGKQNAYSVVLVVGVDTRGREFCLEYVRGQWGPLQILDEYFKILTKYYTHYHVKKFGMETEGGDSHLWDPFVKHLRHESHIPVGKLVEFKRIRTETKDEHIGVLQLPWERDLIYLRGKENADNIVHQKQIMAETEFDRHPAGKTKDIIDVWAHMHRTFIDPKRKPLPKKKDPYGYATRLRAQRTDDLSFKVNF